MNDHLPQLFFLLFARSKDLHTVELEQVVGREGPQLGHLARELLVKSVDVTTSFSRVFWRHRFSVSLW
jgi:hypothetical protein